MATFLKAIPMLLLTFTSVNLIAGEAVLVKSQPDKIELIMQVMFIKNHLEISGRLYKDNKLSNEKCEFLVEPSADQRDENLAVKLVAAGQIAQLNLQNLKYLKSKSSKSLKIQDDDYLHYVDSFYAFEDKSTKAGSSLSITSDKAYDENDVEIKTPQASLKCNIDFNN